MTAPSHAPQRSALSFDPAKAEEQKLILHQLTAELNQVQSRLGTRQEQADDCQLARDLGHRIRNKLHILQMWESLGAIELPDHLKAQKGHSFTIEEVQKV